MMKFITKLLIIFSLIVTAGCEKPADDAAILSSSKTEKSTQIVKFFDPKFTSPSAILDAEMLEESSGTNSRMAPGPGDFTRFYRITIAPNTIESWTKSFVELPQKPSFIAPNNIITWWPTAIQFNTLDFYQSAPLMSQNGWVAVDKNAGLIYILTETI